MPIATRDQREQLTDVTMKMRGTKLAIRDLSVRLGEYEKEAGELWKEIIEHHQLDRSYEWQINHDSGEIAKTGKKK